MKPLANDYYDQKTLFVVGMAGTGKSTELAKRANKKTLVLVPTHKAAEVLMAKGLDNVYTIHSVLKLVPSINENFKRKMTTRLTQIGKTDLSTIKDIFIDEMSMINQEILDLLMSSLPKDCDVTIFGDAYQLPPVTGDPIQPWEPILELTEQHRSNNPEGTKLFTKYAHAVQDYTSVDFTPNITKDWVEMFNPDTDRVLAFTNKRVIQLNTLLSKGKPITYNEPLLMNGIPCEMVTKDYMPRLYPTCITKGEIMDESKRNLASVKAGNDIAKFRTDLSPYKQCIVEAEEGDFLIYYDDNHYANELKLKKAVEAAQMHVIKSNNLSPSEHIPTWCAKNRSATGVRARGQAWSRFLAHRSYVFNLTRPYATTVHKAQGSEFSKVFIDMADMRKALDNQQYNRLCYVAMSRAIDELVFI